MLDDRTRRPEADPALIVNIRKLGSPRRNSNLSCVCEIVESGANGRKEGSTRITLPSITRGIKSNSIGLGVGNGIGIDERIELIEGGGVVEGGGAVEADEYSRQAINELEEASSQADGEASGEPDGEPDGEASGEWNSEVGDEINTGLSSEESGRESSEEGSRESSEEGGRESSEENAEEDEGLEEYREVSGAEVRAATIWSEHEQYLEAGEETSSDLEMDALLSAEDASADFEENYYGTDSADGLLMRLQERIKLSADPDGMALKDLLDEGIRLHDLAAGGNKKAVRRAQKILHSIYEAMPGNIMAEGYYGSSLGLVNDEYLQAETLFEKTAESLQRLGSAVKRDPANIQLRLLRVNLYHRINEHLESVIKSAIKDLHYVLENKDGTVLEEDLYCCLLFNLGLDYLSINDPYNGYAKWLELLDRCSDPKYQTLMALYLND